LKINQDFGMAIQTILYLKDRKSSDFIQAGEIAKELDFSVGYLQKVIQMLSKNGLLECKRGRVGGVKLRANVITLLDLWEITCGKPEFLDPSLAIMEKPLKAFVDSMNKIVVYKKSKK